MGQPTLKAEQVLTVTEVWRFIQQYFALPYNDVTCISYSYKAGDFSGEHYLHVERINAKESICLSYAESDKFAITLLREFNLDWRPVTSLSFDIDSESIAVFDLGVFPFVSHDKVKTEEE